MTVDFGGSVCQIIAVETVRAYHFGVNYLVEVDIVLPGDMPLRESHDIAETLQVRPCVLTCSRRRASPQQREQCCVRSGFRVAGLQGC